jgi:hypothetical protein
VVGTENRLLTDYRKLDEDPNVFFAAPVLHLSTRKNSL